MWLGWVALLAFAIFGFVYWLFATMTAQTQRKLAQNPPPPAEPGDVTYARTRLGTWSVTVIGANRRPTQVYALDEEEAHHKGEELARRARSEAGLV